MKSLGGNLMFKIDFNESDFKKFHFIGIGGVSMSGLAEILINEGFYVSGSDATCSETTEKLKKLGALINIGHSTDNINNPDLVIYTDAISSDNLELCYCIEHNIPLMDRASFLGQLMNLYENSIAISGTHGKTTTTSMLATITNDSELDPTILLGGNLDIIGGNVKIGRRDYIISEACEYKGNVLKYYPSIAIVLNIDEDHLDYFKSMDHIVDTFKTYSQNIKDNGYLIINKDDLNSQKLIDATRANVVTFGIENDCDYRAENIVFSSQGFSSFTLNIKNKSFYKVNLNVMGNHNIYNALASIVASHISGLSIEYILEKICEYKGVHRRLELKGLYKKAKIFDDYAHHPAEIKATLDAVRNSCKGNLYCIFQPHTFTRTKILLDSFSKAFEKADRVIITDIYAAREIDLGDVHSKDLASAVKKVSDNSIYLSTFTEIENYITDNVKADDMVITMGAGNIFLVGESILNKSVKKEKAIV